MTTTVIKSIGTGKDFPGLWEFMTYANARDLVADDEVLVAELYEDYLLPYGYGVLSPTTSSEVNCVIVRPAAGLGVNAGHDLNQANLPAFLAAVPGVQEVSIGHALIGEALHDGLAATVAAYRRIVDAAR